MKIPTGTKKVRANEFLVATKAAKTALVTLRRWFIKFRKSSDTGISANRENEINEARMVEKRETMSPVFNEDELRNIAKENMENELRELMSSGLTSNSA